jgi:hypothetical protein
LISATVWALAPLESPDIARPVSARSPDDSPSASVSSPALDQSAFRVPLWIAQVTTSPAAVEPVIAAPPRPPLRLQLLAIIRDEATATYRAMVYDPDTDRVLVGSVGERFIDQTIASVDAGSLRLRDDSGGEDRVLALKTAGGSK